MVSDDFPTFMKQKKSMLGLRFAQPSSARNGSESRACGGRQLRKPSKTVIVHLLLRKRRNEVSEIGDFGVRLSPLKKAEIAAMRSLRYRSDFRCAAIRSALKSSQNRF